VNNIDQNQLAIDLDKLNAYPTLGNSSVFVNSGQEFGFEVEVLPDDVTIYNDFCDDDLRGDDDAVNKFRTWYTETLYDQLVEYMAKLGYTFIDENDGSGGGLHYGAMLFRKAVHAAAK
jgi:hypothetical protein